MALLNVKTAYGEVQGIAGSNGKCSVFKAIPYAKPPVGSLRFRPAQKMEPWHGIKVCDEFAPAPMQPVIAGTPEVMSEDCLYLNIWTPAEKAGEKLPVFFWIYGGAFTFGYSHEPVYDGEALAERGCILVTINYRVNVFGFFNTPELEEINGGAKCCGILDQIAALEWVKENIEQFGGDPDNILVFGQSAGGMSTRMLLTSPLTEGKFARAVVHSGGGLSEGDLVRPTEEFRNMCVRTLEHVGWTFDDIMKADSQEVFDVMTKGVREMMNDGDLQYFQPFIDGCALTEVPGVKIYKGDYHKVPIICLTVAGDSWMFTRKVRKDLEGNISYFRGFAISPSVAWAEHNIETGEEPIYSIYMDRKQPPKEQAYYTHGLPPFGADTPHAAELAYIFGTLDRKGLNYPQFDYDMAEILRSYWVNFAKTGDPNGEGLPVWPKYTAESRKSMHFGDDGFKLENVITNDDEKRVITFCKDHPGMLCSLEDF